MDKLFNSRLQSITKNYDATEKLAAVAWLTGQPMEIEYETEKGATRRQISPLGIVQGENKILAYCHLRRSIRAFRKDRIKTIISPVV